MKASRLKLLAGAMSPIWSPGRRAGGLKILGPVKEFTLADQLRRPAQKDLTAGPAYGLRAASSVHVRRRIHAAGSDRCHRGRARARPGRLRLADAAFVEADFDVVPALDLHEFHVDAMLEVVMASDFRRLRLPCRWKFLHKDHKVRVAHGDRSAMDFAEGNLDGKVIAYLRFAHVSLKLKAVPVARQELAVLDTSAGADGEFPSVTPRNQVGSDTARAVAGDFRLTAVSVDEPRAYISVLRRKKPFHAVGSNAVMAVADPLAERIQISRRFCAIDDKEIIAAGRCLGEWDLHLFDFRTGG